jgi:hypothetical protein
LAQAVQRIDGPGRGSPRALNQVVADAGEPLKGHLMNSMDELRKANRTAWAAQGNTPGPVLI